MSSSKSNIFSSNGFSYNLVQVLMTFKARRLAKGSRILHENRQLEGNVAETAGREIKSPWLLVSSLVCSSFSLLHSVPSRFSIFRYWECSFLIRDFPPSSCFFSNLFIINLFKICVFTQFHPINDQQEPIVDTSNIYQVNQTLDCPNHYFTLQSVHVRKNQTSPKQLPLTPAFIILNQLVQYNFATQNEAPNYLAAAHLYSRRNFHSPPSLSLSLSLSFGVKRNKHIKNHQTTFFTPNLSQWPCRYILYFPLNRPSAFTAMKNKTEKKERKRGEP